MKRSQTESCVFKKINPKCGGFPIPEPMLSGRTGSDSPRQTANKAAVHILPFSAGSVDTGFPSVWEPGNGRVGANTREPLRNASAESPARESGPERPRAEPKQSQRGGRTLSNIIARLYLSDLKIQATSHTTSWIPKRAAPEVRVKNFLQPSKCFLGQNEDSYHPQGGTDSPRWGSLRLPQPKVSISVCISVWPAGLRLTREKSERAAAEAVCPPSILSG